MFFSPLRIPVGLTDDEVRIIVNLYPLRKAQNDRRFEKAREIGDVALLHHVARSFKDPEPLPKELWPIRKMTRARFRQGIWKFLLQVHT